MGKQKIIKITIIIIAGFFLLGIVKDFLLKSAVTLGASHVTGAPVKIKRFSLGIITQNVSIKGFKMYNPKGFEKAVMVDIPEITVQCNIFSLFSGKLHVKKVVVNLREMLVVKNKEGALNVDALKIAQTSERPKKAEDAPPVKKKNPPTYRCKLIWSNSIWDRWW